MECTPSDVECQNKISAKERATIVATNCVRCLKPRTEGSCGNNPPVPSLQYRKTVIQFLAQFVHSDRPFRKLAMYRCAKARTFVCDEHCFVTNKNQHMHKHI